MLKIKKKGETKMTVEEIEIIVTAKVEEALKEFQKILPEMTKIIKQAQEQLANVDMSKLQKAVKQQMPLFKKQIQNLKKSIENNDISIKINNKDAEKQISQTQKQIDSLQEKINARQMKLNVINPQIDKIVDDTRKNVTPEGINPNDKAMDATVNNALNGNKDFTSLNSQAQKLYTEIEMYNKQLDVVKSKMAELKQQTSQTATTQNKLSSFFSAFKQKIEQVKPTILGVKNIFSKMPNIGQNLSKETQSITNNIKGIGTGFKNGLGQVLKYAGALFSLRSIYSALSSSANAWLSSQNAQAKQLSANIDYMKYAMGSALAPVIQFVTNCVYQLLKAVQSVVYALFRVNIFANASASAFKNAQKQAKNTSKSLSSVHSEINNVGDHNSNASPNVGDLSSIDNQMSPLSQKLYDFFKPLVDSWNKYGVTLIEQIKITAGQIASLISSVWGSIEKLITNGTVYTSLELILAIIGNIAEAFSNAWKYEGNGDTIIQTMADMLNSILNTIREITASEGFQKFLNGVSNAFSGILTFTKPVLDDFLSLIKPLSEIALSIAGDILNSIGNALKWIGDNEIAVTILESLAIAIGLVVAGIKSYNFVQSGALVATLKHTAALIAQGVAWVAANWPILLIVAAITAVIAIIILCVKHWDEIKETVTNVCNKMKETVSNWVNNVGQFFSNLKFNIVNKVAEIRDGIKNKFQEAYNGIRNIFSNIGNFFNGIWKNIKNTFTNLGTSIGNAISGAVKAGINGVISLIEKTINTAIRLINGGIKLINLIPGVSVGTINTLNLPRLAKGNVAYDETLAIFGEYSGASNNPEITTPQNIMRDTFEDVLSDFNSNNGQPLHVTIQYLGKDIFDDTIDYINSKTRRTGKNTIVTVGD
jgi:phage-related protein|nr:MAG TPA: minor tail protein [Caudoviricetes sp.]